MTRTAILFSGARGALDPVRLTAQSLADLGVADLCVVGAERDLGLENARVRYCASAEEARPDGRALVVLADHLVAPAALGRLLECESEADVVALTDRVADRAFDPESALRLPVDGVDLAFCGAFVAAPDVLRGDDVFAAVRRAARKGRVESVDAAGALWHRVTDDASRRHAEWLLRVFGPTLEARPAGGDGDATASLIGALLREKDARPYVLMNPGPVMTSARVKGALVQPDMCHRDGEYHDVLRGLRRKLARVFRAGPEHTVLLLTGSGTAAMEAAIASTVPRGRKLLVVQNGAFGERLGEIAETHFLETVRVRYEWGQSVAPADVEAALRRDPAIFAVAMIHHETSTCLLNPAGEVGAICRRMDRLLIADTVSSLGAEDVDVVRDRIDVCVSSANKCLHGIAGVSFVCVHDRVWDRIEATPPRVFYLDLRRYRAYAEKGQTPFTPAVPTFFALEAAVDELLEEGLTHRQAVYRRRARRLRAGLRALGCEFLTSTGRESSTVTTVRLPGGVAFPALYREMKARGYVVYDCKEPLQGRYFQVANMGELPDEAIEGFIEAMGDAFGRAHVRRPALTLVAGTHP